MNRRGYAYIVMKIMLPYAHNFMVKRLFKSPLLPFQFIHIIKGTRTDEARSPSRGCLSPEPFQPHLAFNVIILKHIFIH